MATLDVRLIRSYGANDGVAGVRHSQRGPELRMAVEQVYDMGGNRRTTYDTSNPRVYRVEVKCYVCALWFDEEQIIWATADGALSTLSGLPYCHSDAPDLIDGEPIP